MHSRNKWSKPEGKEDENDQIIEIKYYSWDRTDRDVACMGGLWYVYIISVRKLLGTLRRMGVCYENES